MKGKNVFTKEEDLVLERLIVIKQESSRSEQKLIRGKIRNIGFYYTDFSNKKDGYTIEDYRKLKRDGIVVVVGEESKLKENPMPKSHSVVSTEKLCSNANLKKGLAPLVGENPRVLILGTLPGDKSIEKQAYYSSPNNSFWKILNALFEKKIGQSNEDFAKEIGIALWDCCHSGVRKGSGDDGFDQSTIKPNDLKQFLKDYPSIKVIVLNGKGTKVKYYDKYFNDIKTPRAIALTSTSNASSISFESKLEEWSKIKKWLDEDK